MPPRFAGATLLALGNGSPDLGSTVNAILLWNDASANNNPSEGWTMSLGSLAGGGMFVGTIVCGLLIQSCSGIPCRWAFLRDVSMYLLSVCVVWHTFESGSVTKKDALRFLWMYFSYVMIVFAADMYHRKVTLHRLHKEEKQRRKSLTRKFSELVEENKGNGDIANEATPLMENLNEERHVRINGKVNIMDAEASDIPSYDGNFIPRVSRLSLPDKFAMLMSNYDPASVKFDVSLGSSGSGDGDESEWQAMTTMIHDVHPGIHSSLRIHPVPEAGQQIRQHSEESLSEQHESSVIAEQDTVRQWSIGLFIDAYDELVFRYHHFLKNSFQNETSFSEKLGLFIELPFVAVRTVSLVLQLHIVL